MKIQTRKGFTLTELLIVMAIIVVLAAVAVPTFGKQLETSRETGDMEIIRNAYTEALSAAVLDAADGKINGKLNDGTTDDASTAEGTDIAGLEYLVGGKYIVSLSEMNSAAFSQRKYAGSTAPTDNETNRKAIWKYVSPTFMERTVPIVHTETQFLTFTFKILEASDLTATPFQGKGYSVGDVVLVKDDSAFAINAYDTKPTS